MPVIFSKLVMISLGVAMLVLRIRGREEVLKM
jgi:hypothetical protein